MTADPERQTASPKPTTGRKLRRIPLVAVAAALAGGIAIGPLTPIPTAAWAVAAAAAFAIAVATFRRPHLAAVTNVSLAAAVLALGAVRVRLASFSLDENHLSTYVGHRANLATIRGRVVTEPHVWANPSTMGYPRPPRTSFLLAATGVRTEQDGRTLWRPAVGLVRVAVENARRSISPGTDLELMGWMGRLSGPANPGQYDWARAARRDGILVRMNVPHGDAVTTLAGADRPWYARMLWHLRAGAYQHLAAAGGATEGQLLGALIIGERHPALRKLNQAMVRAGIAHFLSISGLHLAIFVGFVYLLCRACLLGSGRSAAVVLVLLGAYLLIATPRPPLLRSAIMAGALCLAAMSHRRYSSLNALAGAAVVLLAMAPVQLFAPGFQLSFVIVGGLIVLCPLLQRWLFGHWLDRRGLMVFRNEQRLRRWLMYQAANWLVFVASACLTCFLVAVPLLAYHFGRFSPYGPLLSLLVLPLVVAVLVPGYVSIALAWPMPNLSRVIANLAGDAAGLLARAVEAIEHLPGLTFELRPVPVWWVLLAYATIALVAVQRRVRFGRVPVAAACMALAAATVLTQRTAPPPDQAQLDLLAVGAGQCAVLRTPQGQTYIIDAGSRSTGAAGERALLPFLRHQRLPRPDAAILSHANTDHYNALPAVLRSGPLDRVYLNDYFGAEETPAKPVGELMGMLAEGGVRIVRLRAGETIRLDERTSVEVVWPPPVKRDDLSVNDTSLVLRITCDGVRVLVAGDLDDVGQRELTSTPEKIRCDVLVLPHHGGWEKTLPDFFKAADPHTVLVSGNRDPIGPLPKDGPARRFYVRIKTTRKYYSTSRNGWIRLRFGSGKTSVQTMR